MAKRKFYKTLVTIEVLSEDKPVADDLTAEDLYRVADEILDGSWSGAVKVSDPVELSGEEAAQALIEQESDPSFFNLAADGRDLDDEDNDEDE